MIEVKELVKRYGSHLAVDRLSFTVEKGQVFGFLGPNGAGKSTTMNIMTGYLAPTQGEVLVDGYSVQRQPVLAKRRLGYLPEQPPLYVDMTVEEYLMFAAQLKGVPKGERRDHVADSMGRTGVAGVSRRLIRNLSKGYRQRVGLAMSLLGNPQTLILDEPTVGLDPKQIAEIRALIRDLAREHTVILSSHILSEVREVCDEILIIHHGRAVAQGAPAQLEWEMAGEAALRVLLRAPAPTAQAVFAALPGAVKVDPLPDVAEDEVGFELTFREGQDGREDVYRACVAGELPLLELRSRRATLEDIFLRLTADAGTEPSAEDDAGDGDTSEDDAPDGDAVPDDPPAARPAEPDGQLGKEDEDDGRDL